MNSLVKLAEWAVPLRKTGLHLRIHHLVVGLRCSGRSLVTFDHLCCGDSEVAFGRRELTF